MDFGMVWGGQVGAKLAPKSIKMQSKMTPKKKSKYREATTFLGTIDVGPGTPREGDLGGGTNETSCLSQHANGPKARRI